MELRQLRYILSIARIGNMTRTAELLHVSQSALSLSYHNLEDELGVKLFEKKGRILVLTDAGTRFCRESERILSDIDQLVLAMKDYGELPQEEITCFSDAIDVSSEAMALYSLFFPNVVFTHRRGLQLQYADILKSGRADFALTLNDISHGSLHSTFLFREPILAVLQKDSPLAQNSSCTIAELSRYPLITLPDSYAVGQQHRSFFTLAGCAPQKVIDADGTQSVLFYTSRGRGISFIPESIYNFQTKQINNFNQLNAVLPVRDSFCARTVFLTTHDTRKKSKLSTAFISFLIDFSSYIREHKSFPSQSDFVCIGKYLLQRT